jgi:DNA-binding winged helix-turn-helix (wHTH) protein
MHRHGDKEPIMVNWNNTFQFDLQQLRLTNLLSGRECTLTRNEGLLLQALVDGISAKHDLINEVWTRHHAVVTENSYYQLVSLLRKSFGSIDLPGTIVTLPRKGLALAHPVVRDEHTPAPAAAAILGTGVPESGSQRVLGGSPARTSASGGDRHTKRTGAWQWPRVAGPWMMAAVTLGCIVLIAALGAPLWVSFPSNAKNPSSQATGTAEPVSLAATAQSSIAIGDTTLHYSKIPADTALRVWRD